jgi:hypothetical protein
MVENARKLSGVDASKPRKSEDSEDHEAFGHNRQYGADLDTIHDLAGDGNIDYDAECDDDGDDGVF